MTARKLKIPHVYDDPVLNLAMDTINLKKQALIFVNTKRAAESEAEKISLKIKTSLPINSELAEKALNVLSKPTRQCIRLGLCLKKGIAFHHAGLDSAQRELIEEHFRKGNIKIICATPTLAMGVDLPAFRTILRDLKRYSFRGLAPIPVLEYEQMSGRAGRPGMEEYGEAIAIARSEAEKENIHEKYILGEPEDINSKLAVEPVLRTYVLSLIATEFVNDFDSLMEFFKRTFYAHQFKDLAGIKQIIMKILKMLEEWEFIKAEEFRSADEIGKLEATQLGARVSELYLDPLDAYYMLTSLRSATAKLFNDFSFLFMISRTLSIRPLLNVKMSEFDEIQEKYVEFLPNLLEEEPSEYSEEYEAFLNSLKTALFFYDWINEKDEEYLLEKYSIRPGEIHAKLGIADWLIYSSSELCRLLNFKKLASEMIKLRYRLAYGAKEELMPLLKLRNIGRVRARKLFKNNITSIADVKKAELTALSQLIGRNIAIDIKKQVGQEVPEKIKENKRKGQINLSDFTGSS